MTGIKLQQIKISHHKENAVKFKQYINEVLIFLHEASSYYPTFHEWYATKVIPEITIGKREIILYYSQDELVGVIILKKDNLEKKISTIQVKDQFRKKGIGKKLITDGLVWLQTDKPLITIPKEKISEFSSLLSYFKFKLTDTNKNLYVDGKEEYIFNGKVN